MKGGPRTCCCCCGLLCGFFFVVFLFFGSPDLDTPQSGKQRLNPPPRFSSGPHQHPQLAAFSSRVGRSVGLAWDGRRVEAPLPALAGSSLFLPRLQGEPQDGPLPCLTVGAGGTGGERGRCWGVCVCTQRQAACLSLAGWVGGSSSPRRLWAIGAGHTHKKEEFARLPGLSPCAPPPPIYCNVVAEIARSPPPPFRESLPEFPANCQLCFSSPPPPRPCVVIRTQKGVL